MRYVLVLVWLHKWKTLWLLYTGCTTDTDLDTLVTFIHRLYNRYWSWHLCDFYTPSVQQILIMTPLWLLYTVCTTDTDHDTFVTFIHRLYNRYWSWHLCDFYTQCLYNRYWSWHPNHITQYRIVLLHNRVFVKLLSALNSWSVYVYICMYVCMYLCMYLCMYVCMYVFKILVVQ
jgi:hypothetical protein